MRVAIKVKVTQLTKKKKLTTRLQKIVIIILSIRAKNAYMLKYNISNISKYSTYRDTPLWDF